MGFAENVKNELDFQGMQLKELSIKTGISRNTLDKYLSNIKATQPGVGNAVKIAQALGVSVEYLVLNSENNKTETKILSKEQQQIIRKYNTLDNFNKKTIQDLLQSLSSRQPDKH